MILTGVTKADLILLFKNTTYLLQEINCSIYRASKTVHDCTSAVMRFKKVNRTAQRVKKLRKPLN